MPYNIFFNSNFKQFLKQTLKIRPADVAGGKACLSQPV